MDTSCCIVGAGPGGMLLALLLARRGVPVTLLEAQKDFDREFRGDTLHPAILELLDQIGLAEALHQLPHMKWLGPSLVTAKGTVPLMDFSRLGTKYPWVMLLPQERFLEFLAAEAVKYPHFRLLMGARVQELIEEDGVVRGVRYRESGSETLSEVRAHLTVGADGRFSRVRHLAGIEPEVLSDPMELLWFRLPRLAGDAETFDAVESVVRGKPFAIIRGDGGRSAAFIHRGDGFILGVLNRIDHWQVAFIHAPGDYQRLKAAGLDAFRASVLALEPRLAPHLATLDEWRDLSPLSVAFSRCRQWHKPGLLLIGDAAHVMTPAAGAGIKYAIEDAVEAANVLAPRLLAGTVREADLAEVQRRRERPTRVIQAVAGFQQRTVFARALRAGGPTVARQKAPLWARVMTRTPVLRDLPGRFIAFGVWRVRIEDTSDVATKTLERRR